MLRVAYTANFQRDVKRLKKKRYDLGPLEALIDLAPASPWCDSASREYASQTRHRKLGVPDAVR